MNSTMFAVLMAAFGLLWIAPVSPTRADSLRCGRRLVTPGDSAYEVRAVCGDPQSIRARTGWRSVKRLVRVPCEPQRPNGGIALCTRATDELVEVQLEEWIYDFGPRRFMRHLIFEQGQLVRVETGGRGVAASR